MVRRAQVIVRPQGSRFVWEIRVNGRTLAVSATSFDRRRAAWRSWERVGHKLLMGWIEYDAPGRYSWLTPRGVR